MLITDHLKDRPTASDRPQPRTADPRVLIADDQSDVLEALRLLLKGEGFQLETASSPAGVLAAVEAREFDVALIDLNYTRDTTSGEEGLNLLSRVQAIDPTLPVVVMTAWGSVEVAVEAMRRGARDFIQKPWDNARLLAIVRTQIELSQALRKGQRLEAENSILRGEGMPSIVAESPAMQNVLQVVSRVGPSDANVLVLGDPTHGDRELRWCVGRRVRKRVVRARSRRLYGCKGGPRRTVRARRPSDPLPRRDRQRSYESAGQAAARD
jgi:FixJ family two-component response regulator